MHGYVVGSIFGSRRTKEDPPDRSIRDHAFLLRIRFCAGLLASLDLPDAGRCIEWKCGCYENHDFGNCKGEEVSKVPGARVDGTD